jgi:hypothetical protein
LELKPAEGPEVAEFCQPTGVCRERPFPIRYYNLSVCYCSEMDQVREIKVNGEVQEPFAPQVWGILRLENQRIIGQGTLKKSGERCFFLHFLRFGDWLYNYDETRMPCRDPGLPFVPAYPSRYARAEHG